MPVNKSIPSKLRVATLGSLLLFAVVVAASQDSSPDSSGGSASPTSGRDPRAQPADASANTINHLLTRIILDSVPHEYSDTSRWGKTAQRLVGVRWRREGWKLETNRVWATVNHGLWQKYSTHFIDPEHQFSVELGNIREARGDAIAFNLIFVAPLAVEARQAQWVNGVQLYSVSADAEAKIRLQISCELSSTLALDRFPPDVVFRPTATAADVRVESFAVKHISKVGGEIAEQITKLVEAQLGKQIAAQGPKIVEKINRQIEKRAADFRVSPRDALRFPWAEKLWPNLKDRLTQSAESSTPRDAAR